MSESTGTLADSHVPLSDAPPRHSGWRRQRGEPSLVDVFRTIHVPLVMFTRDKAKMGRLVAPQWLTLVAGVIAAIIIALNLKLLWDLAAG